LFLMVVAGLVVRMAMIRRDVERWRTYQQECRSRGEDLGIEAWMPPKVSEADNAFAHPWMRGFLAGKSSPEAEAVAALQEWPGLGLEDYEVWQDSETSRLWFDDRLAERERVLEAGRSHAKDLAAVHEAAARPSARLEVYTGRGYVSSSGLSSNTSQLVHMLGLHAAAALSAGDEVAAVADLEAMLRLGSHFRSQNFLLPQVVGAGMEASALSVIEAGAVGKAFSPASKQRLRAARRSRKIEDELAACWRGERGMFLQTLESAVKKEGRTDAGPITAFFHPPERFLATNSLAFCEMLDPALTPPVSLAGWQDFGRRVALIRRDERRDDPAQLAHTAFIMTGGIVGGMLAQEEEIDRVFKLLDP
jgi:hypothetical protein